MIEKTATILDPTRQKDFQEIAHHTQTNNRTSDRANNVKTARSAPCTPTGTRVCAIGGSNREVPILPRRELSFGYPSSSDCSLNPSTPDRTDNDIACTRSFSLSSSLTDSSSVHTRSVNLYDLIDEEFVVNCGVLSGSRCGLDERIIRRSNSSGSNNTTSCSLSSRSQHRRRKSILDMIDRIDSTNVTDNAEEDSSSVMTTRSYPRGVYVVPPTADRETSALGNVVAFVSSEAYNQW